ncbi:lactosylceramide 4-alpha-galactosyltransferase-like [Drosophila innubila]|uniref:lactosylceramide 4-alpha-galactosyltransferase-like n=1 Tax=Drosophila innubila TaxID=198719 RepID=UPI00148D8DB9|nr:lactosylceramide 4-alpha-galactosyltransferase-like [Drosophila innubila]
MVFHRPLLLVSGAKRLKLLLYALCMIIVFILVIVYNWSTAVRQDSSCFIQTDFQSEARSLPKTLGDVLLTEPKPTPGKTIFFLETSCPHNPHSLQLTARQACAIESAALHNPNFQVFVLFASPRNHPQDNSSGINEPLIDAILSYPNVQLRQLNLMRYAADTPIDDWFKDGQLFRSSYMVVHISDLLRLVTLYRFGGIYMDLDVVFLRSMENVPLNYAGAESDTHIANGVMSLAPTGFGHQFAASCLREFQRNFDGSDWGHNGPGVITRVAQRICATKNITMMLKDRKRCLGFQVFERNAFYAVPWVNWRHFFEPQFLKETLEKTKDSFLIHVWNKHSYQHPVTVDSAYGKIAAQNCPRSYAAAGKYF